MPRVLRRVLFFSATSNEIPRYMVGKLNVASPRVSVLCFFSLQADVTGGAATQSLRRKRKGRNDDELSGEEEGGSAEGASEEQEDDSDDSGTCSWLLAAHTLLFFFSGCMQQQCNPLFTMNSSSQKNEHSQSET